MVGRATLSNLTGVAGDDVPPLAVRVGQVMTRTVRTCGPDDGLDVAARIMWEEDCGAVPVVRTDSAGRRHLVGMVTDRDACIAAYTQRRPLDAIPTRTAMARTVASCVPSDPLPVALKVMRTNRLHRLPVVDGDDQLVGILSLADVAREVRRERQAAGPPSVTAEAVGETILAIATARGGERTVAPRPAR
jgi:CBS domain-containing protein